MKQRSDVLGYCSDMLNCRLRADALRRGTDVGLSAAKTDVSYLDKQTHICAATGVSRERQPVDITYLHIAKGNETITAP